MRLMLSEIAAAVSGELHGENESISTFSIDTRTMKKGDLFVAIQGDRFDGHDFAVQAEGSGAAALLVNRLLPTRLAQIVTADTRLALAELAGVWRRRLSAKVVGVTGSNGKTTVKEMIAAILSVSDRVHYTQGNLNNDIGVPLTLLRMNESHRYAVIEMGANHPGEIAYTSRYAQPDIAVITNAGSAHLEGFGDLQGVARTKGEIISGLEKQGTAVLNKNDRFFSYWKELAAGKKCVSFGTEGDIRAEDLTFTVADQKLCTQFDLCTDTEKTTIELPLAGQHNVTNALAAAAVCRQLGISLAQISRGLSGMRGVNGRLQAKYGTKGNLIIDDTYNANPDSLKAALEVLQLCPGDSWLVLGAFGELGTGSRALHGEMGKTCKRLGVKRLFATGNESRYCTETFGDGAEYYEGQEELIQALSARVTGRETILVKGSRAQHMENVVNALLGGSGG